MAAATPFNVIAANTPTAFGFYGTAYASAATSAMTITTYDGTNINTMSGTGWEVNVTKQTSTSSNVELSATTTAAVQEGDLIVATFYYRRKDSASGAEANFSCNFQSTASPNLPSFSLPLRGRAYPANATPPNGNPVTATDTIWRHVSIPFTSAAAYAAGAAQFNFFMGAAGLQTLDIANVSLTDYGQCSIFGNSNSIDSSSYFTEDTTANGVTYGTMSPINSVNIAGTGLPLYTTATQVQTTVPPPQTWGGPPVTWDFRLDNRLPVPTNVGDTLVALFWTRATAVPSGVPYAVCGITATGCAGGSFNLMIDPNAGWREWIIPLKVVKAETAYNTDFYINFGFQLQTVQIAGIQLMDLGQQLGGSGVLCPLTNQAFDYPGRSLSESWPGNWRATAAANIAKYRQGTLSVNVEDGNGKPLSSVNVAASMTAPLFGFGCQTSSTPVIGWDGNGIVDHNALTLFYQLFNHIEMACYKWGEWETGAQPSYNAKALQTIRALGKGGTFDFRAHNLIWPADSLCPPDVKSINSAAAMTARIDGHITAMVGDPTVHGYFTDWDAVNEPYDHNDEMQVENGLPRYTNGETQPFGAPSVLQAQNDALAIAPWLAFTHATDTHAHLFINDWGIETNTNHIDTSHEDYDANLMTNLENANAHIDGFGFESHFVDAFTAPLLLTKMFSRFANGLAPGHSLIENVTEFDESESSGMAAAFPPDIDLYSDFMNDYLTEIYSQPNFDFFDLWTLGDLYNGYPIAGTNPVQDNWVLMPPGEAWMSLVRNQWWTNTSAASSSSGVATLSNCTLGRYCLTATSGNITKNFYTDLLTTSGNTTTLQISGSSGTSHVWLYEAEKLANPIYSPLAVYSDPAASGGQYVMAPLGGTDNTIAPASPEMRVDTEATGTVNVWMRVNAPNSSEDTFWMAVDSGAWQTAQLSDATGWHWVKVSTSLALAAGTSHSLFLAHGKCGAQLDQVIITDDLSFIPASSPVFAVGAAPPVAITGNSYNYPIGVLGSPASTLSMSGGSLPPGLSLSTNGVVSGVPTQTGTYPFTVSATNSVGSAVTQSYTIAVYAPGARTPTPSLNPEPSLTLGASSTVSWNSVAGGVQYEVQASTSPSFSTIIDSGWITGTSYTFNGLAVGTTYYYRVRSSGGPTGNWSQASATDFSADMLTTTSNGSGGVTLTEVSSILLTGVITNPSFETASPAFSGWTTSTQGNVSCAVDSTSAFFQDMPTDGASFAVFQTIGGTNVSAGDNSSFSQSVNLTGVSTLQFDAVLGLDSSWNNEIEVDFLIDGNVVWTQTASGTYLNQAVPINGLTGVHTIMFRAKALAGFSNVATTVAIDNVRAYSNSYDLNGSVIATAINPTPLQAWGTLTYANNASAGGTALTVDVLNTNGTLLASNVASGTNLSGLASVATATGIELRANLFTTSAASSPSLQNWSVNYYGSGVSGWSGTATSTQGLAPTLTNGAFPATMPVNTAFTFSYAAGGSPSPTFSVSSGALPTGLTLSSTGTVTGMPTATGTFTGAVSAGNGLGSNAMQSFSTVVTQPPAILSDPPPGGTAGVVYNFAYSVSGCPAPTFTSSVGSLPAGLSLSSSGVLSGTPATWGVFTGTVTASNGAGTPATQAFSLTFNSTYNSWAGLNFTNSQLSNLALTAPNVSFENDGVTNVMKYLFDINPTEIMTPADMAALPVAGTTTSNGVSYLTLTYRENPLLSGITVGVQTSTDLQTWTTVMPSISQQVGTDSNTGDPIERVGVILTNASCQFIRLNVTTP